VNKAIRTILVLVLALAVCSFAFANGTSEQGKPMAKGAKVKIGLSFSDFATERWPVEQALLTKLGYDKGAQVISQVANTTRSCRTTRSTTWFF
jgi:hypothetical protein